jgi:hypothetical protein
LVHILHQDDYVSAVFYRRIEEAASAHPDVGLIATRSFVVNGTGIIMYVGPRVPALESGGRCVSDFYYSNPLWFPGVVVRRNCYGQCGRFRTDLIFAVDVEMWTRVIGQCGGVVLPDVLAYYRHSRANETAKFRRSGKAFEDMIKLMRIYGERYTDIDLARLRREICLDALWQAKERRQAGDHDSAAALLAFWESHATVKMKLRRVAYGLARRLGKALQ